MLTPLTLLFACGTTPPPLGSQEAVTQGYQAFIEVPNAEASGRTEAEGLEIRDAVFASYVEASFLQHVGSWAVFNRLEEVTDDYAYVTTQLQDAALPEVLAAIPYLESQYRPDVQSRVCAKGPWQFMPEVGHRMGLEIRDCAFISDPQIRWTPTAPSPPRPLADAEYLVDFQCQITSCAVDQRTDLVASTAAAVEMFTTPWADPDFRASGALVQLTIATHNGGYDDSVHDGVKKGSNIKIAFENWRKKAPGEEAQFAGANIKTESPDETSFRGSVLAAETQHYAYTVVAQHLVAVCYYGKNHADKAAFADWAGHHEGWCQAFDIPSTAEVLKRR